MSNQESPASCSRCSAVWQKCGVTNCWSGNPETAPPKPGNCPSTTHGDLIATSYDGKLTATNQYGTETASVTIKVSATARILSFTASPSQSQNPGDPIRLAWSTSGATEVSISGIGAVTPTGQLDVTPQGATTYTLTARGPANTATQSITVPVSGNRGPTIILNVADYFQTTLTDHTFDASASIDPDGGTLTYQWVWASPLPFRSVTLGSPNSAATTVKLSPNSGEYLINLTVTSSKGVSVTKLIRVLLRGAVGVDTGH